MDKNIRNILENLKEEFMTDSKSNVTGDYREIFVNPSRSEIRDLNETEITVRFIADKRNRDVFVAGEDVFHERIAKEIGMNSYEWIKECFAGVGSIVNGKIQPEDFTDAYHNESNMSDFKILLKDILTARYDWLERYNFDLYYINDVAEEELEWIQEEEGLEELEY